MADFKKLKIDDGSGEGDDAPESTGAEMKYRLPFGLCQKYKINLPKGATPRDAWDALKGKGINPDTEYDKLDDNKGAEQKDKQSEQKVDVQKAVEDMAASSRVTYSKTFTQKRVLENLSAGNEEMRGTTATLFNSDSFGYNCNERDTAYYPGFNKVCIKGKDDGGENSAYSKGGTFYHETWHAIDGNYGVSQEIYQKAYDRIKQENPNDYDFTWARKARNETENMSSCMPLSTGKTFHETVVAESKAVNWSAVRAEIAAEKKAYWEKNGVNVDEVIQTYNDADERYKKGDHTGYWDAALEYNKIMVQNPNELVRKWGDLSDVRCGLDGDKGPRLCGIGHVKNYWKKDKYNRGCEAFAECASAKATNPESYAVLKKYIPQTVAAFEEIYSKLKKGEIKSNGRPQYQP